MHDVGLRLGVHQSFGVLVLLPLGCLHQQRVHSLDVWLDRSEVELRVGDIEGLLLVVHLQVDLAVWSVLPLNALQIIRMSD